MTRDPRQNFIRPASDEKCSALRGSNFQHPRPPLPPSASAAAGRGGRNFRTNVDFNLRRDAAVRLMQSWVRVWLLRAAYKKERRARLTSLKMVMRFKKLLMSEVNSLWTQLGTNFPKVCVVSKILEKEGEESEQLLAAMVKREEEQAACEEAKAATQLDRILQEEAAAEKEVAEAVEAEAKLKKEEDEAMEWRLRDQELQADVDKFQALMEGKGDKATDHERQILSNKLTLLEKTKGRAGTKFDLDK